jgi:D-cysteine desulfhydrase
MLAELPTPLQPLDRISEEFDGPRIWVKRDDLTGCALSGNKVRKLEFNVAEALEQECDTLITCGGIQSNHCRATALVGARLGLKVHLVLRGEASGVPDGNLLLDKLFGAEITYLPREKYSTNLPEVFDELVADYGKRGHKAFPIPVGASDEIGVWGYLAACAELQEDFRRHAFTPDHIICATGSGGTLAGLIAGNALFGIGAKIWGVNVCDDAEHFINKVRHDLRKWKVRYGQSLDVDALEVNVLDGYVGPGYAMATQETFELIKHVARTEGMVLDPVYTAKAFTGLRTEIERGRFRRGENVVFIHTGGIFGVFAQRDSFQF